MRPGTFLAAAVLLLAGALAQGAFLRPTEAETAAPPAITDCAQAIGAAVQGEHCSQTSLDSTPGFIVSHLVLAGACDTADLHVIRYLPEGGNPTSPLVAAYCA
jgi:hypothetical protein